MSARSVTLFVVAAALLVVTTLAKLPSSITACSRNLPHPEPCIQAAAEKVRPLLAVGDLGDGFKTPPMEPLALESISMSRGPEFQATFKNLLVNGPSNFQIESLKANIPDLTFDFTVMLPKLNFTGLYALKIKLLLLNIQGKGDVTGSLKNTRGVVRIQGKRVPRNGVDYVTFQQLDSKVKIGKAKFHLANLFNGDPVLNEVGNQFINDNSDLFVAEMIPGMEKSLSKTFLTIANTIMTDVTFDEMFPDTPV